MLGGFLGKKLGMTSVFDTEGNMIPVTVIEAGPCVVMQVKTGDKDGYSAVQLGFEDKRSQNFKKPETGHARKANTVPKNFLGEIRLEEAEAGGYDPGQEVRVEQVFQPGDYVDVTGRSIGKGYAGVMKLYGFSGGTGSHGTHEYFRHGGSIGMSATPGRVFRGKKMPRQLGNARSTVLNLKVVEVRPDDNLLLVKGAVPGHKNSYLLIRHAVKKPRPERSAAA
jgi:large subunit ribosomal protein L3